MSLNANDGAEWGWGVGIGQRCPWGRGREVAAIQARGPGWLPQDSADLPASVVLHHIFLERKPLLPCLKGTWSPDSCSFQISENFRGKDFSAGKARRLISIRCISQQCLHFAAALLVPGQVGEQYLAGLCCGWYADSSHQARASGTLLPPVCSPLGPSTPSDSPWDSGDSHVQSETLGCLKLPAEWQPEMPRVLGGGWGGFPGPLCPAESEFLGLGLGICLCNKLP